MPNLNKTCATISEVTKPFPCKQVSMSELKEIAGRSFPLPSIENAGKNFVLLKLFHFGACLCACPNLGLAYFPNVEQFVSEITSLFTETSFFPQFRVANHSQIYSRVWQLYRDHCARCCL